MCIRDSTTTNRNSNITNSNSNITTTTNITTNPVPSHSPPPRKGISHKSNTKIDCAGELRDAYAKESGRYVTMVACFVATDYYIVTMRQCENNSSSNSSQNSNSNEQQLE